jgi:hypothetical protein
MFAHSSPPAGFSSVHLSPAPKANTPSTSSIFTQKRLIDRSERAVYFHTTVPSISSTAHPNIPTMTKHPPSSADVMAHVLATTAKTPKPRIEKWRDAPT